MYPNVSSREREALITERLASELELTLRQFQSGEITALQFRRIIVSLGRIAERNISQVWKQES